MSVVDNNADSQQQQLDDQADNGDTLNEASIAEAAAAALDLRHRGNFEFAAGRYDTALSLYTAAIEQCRSTAVIDGTQDVRVPTAQRAADTGDTVNSNNEGTNPSWQPLCDEMIVNLCNRSACYSQQEEWESSRDDAQEAWTLSQYTSIKAAYRLSKTCLQLRDYDTAKQTIQAALLLIEKTMENESQNATSLLSFSSEQVNDENDGDASAAAKPATDTASATNSTTTTTNTTMQQQRLAFDELWKQVLAAALKNDNDTSSTSDENQKTAQPETSIKYVKRPVSIKEFTLSRELGHGNFSEIISVTHKVTHEQFALKKIEKKQAADLFKRQHPNVYNEIQMERRVLLERLSSPGHVYIVRMYHAFQDYNSLYYLMDLHVERTDLWSQLRYKNLPGYGDTMPNSPAERLVMMGCHRSTARLWLYQLLSALEYMHSRGIVHRDLKAENILLSRTGHVVVIDFGTAKDVLCTDLNGPEFVGTPDFMSPEAVTGTDPSPQASSLGQYPRGPGGGNGSPTESVEGNAETSASLPATAAVGAGPAADLWALGALAFILQTGHTPYWSPSQYLAFLKIKRALNYPNVMRPTGVVDDDCWDLIVKLMAGNPMQRLGAQAFVPPAPTTVSTNASGGDDSANPSMTCQPGGYDCIREHAYFAPVHSELRNSSKNSTSAKKIIKSKALPIPSLWDLCVRAVAEMAYRDALDIELCDCHLPGDGSRHDLLRLGPAERAAVLHCLDRRRLLGEHPRLYARFFAHGTPSARLDKIRPSTHDVVGLTQMNDDHGKPPRAQMNDPYAKPITSDPISIVVITNPLFSEEATATTTADMSMDEETATIRRKLWTKLLKKCVARINKTRPKLVVALMAPGRAADETVRKILARISETIPTVVYDGSGNDTYCTFWMTGVQCIALQASSLADSKSMQMEWLREQLEQVRMSKHPLFCFVHADPNKLNPFVIKKLARGRTLCLFGLPPMTSSSDTSSAMDVASGPTTTSNNQRLDYKATYEPNELVDDMSIRSTDSDDDDKDRFSMKIKGTVENGLYVLAVEDEPDMWTADFEAIGLE